LIFLEIHFRMLIFFKVFLIVVKAFFVINSLNALIFDLMMMLIFRLVISGFRKLVVSFFGDCSIF